MFIQGHHEGDDYPAFASSFLSLGNGYCWRVAERDEEGKVSKVDLVEGSFWEKELAKLTNRLTWYHQRQKRGEKGVWRRRKIKDRVKLSSRDLKDRPHSDVARATFELRPDHSRAVQYLLESGREREVREFLMDATVEKCRLFEAIYGRKVTFGAVHNDSGHHHDDLWHDGIEEVADAEIKATNIRRKRTPHREFGVGPGVAAWARHENVLGMHCFLQRLDHKVIMGATVAAIEESSNKARDQNGVEPRDLVFNRELDAWAALRLAVLDQQLVNKAKAEYAEYLIAGYEKGLLGLVRKEQRDEKLRARVTALELENEKLRMREKEISELVLSEVGTTLTERVAAAAGKARKMSNVKEAVNNIVLSLTKGLKAISAAVSELAKLVEIPFTPPPMAQEKADRDIS